MSDIAKIFWQGDPHKPFANWDRWRTYGDMVCVDLIGFKTAISYNPDHWPHIIRGSGKTPGPLQLLPWLHRERQKKKADPSYQMNLFALEGSEWRENRTVLDAVFTSIPRVQSYLPAIDLMANDFVALLRHQLQTNGTGTTDQLYDLLYSFSNEVIGSVVYGLRMGNLTLQGRSPLNEEFLQTLLELFSVASELQYGIPLFMFFSTPLYRRFCRLLDKLEALGHTFVEAADQWHQQHPLAPGQSRFDLLQHMRDKGQSPDRINSNSITMFTAGSDSTTHSIMWLLYNLGRFQRVQDKLREEVQRLLPTADSQLRPETLHEMKYLRAVVKESLRLTPTAPGFGRMCEQPIQVGGYEIPAGVMVVAMMYHTNFDARIFPDPRNFLPERWIEEDRGRRPHPWAALPFGSGPRMCQAARLAELESYVLIAKLIKHFKWQTLNQVKPRLDLFIHPETPPEIKWEMIDSSIHNQ